MMSDPGSPNGHSMFPPAPKSAASTNLTAYPDVFSSANLRSIWARQKKQLLNSGRETAKPGASAYVWATDTDRIAQELEWAVRCDLWRRESSDLNLRCSGTQELQAECHSRSLIRKLLVAVSIHRLVPSHDEVFPLALVEDPLQQIQKFESTSFFDHCISAALL